MTHDELENYISKFHEYQRDNVLKEILDSQLLAKAFSTTEGKLILNSGVDIITSNVMKITADCVKEDFDSEKIKPLAFEISTTFKMMTKWAHILIKGDEHENKAERIKK